MPALIFAWHSAAVMCVLHAAVLICAHSADATTAVALDGLDAAALVDVGLSHAAASAAPPGIRTASAVKTRRGGCMSHLRGMGRDPGARGERGRGTAVEVSCAG